MNLQISYNWIKEYLKTDKSVKDFVSEFSLKSQTIDRVTPVKPKFKKVITAKILEISKHPDADKLQLVKIDTGRSKPTIVCGAPNIKVGQIVPYAQVGATVIDSHEKEEKTFVIKKAKIRGQESKGMLCSQAELGLGEDRQGIMILPSGTPIGKPLESIILLEDTLFDIEITSNRPDAMSVIGLAMEGAAATGGKFNWHDPKVNYKIKKEFVFEVEVAEKKLCPRYQAVVMTDVKIGPSPMWMQLRLIQAGRKPINNIIDITNYVALEFGQPVHVFDYDKLQGKKIIVRNAKRGEKILALDGETYKLDSNNLVIADGKNPVAVAGVMGGEKSSTTAKTKTIVFEVANFEPIQVRRTARSLNLHSDSSSLFEKGLHPEGTAFAITRCMELAQELAKAKVATAIIDVNNTKYKPSVILLNVDNINRCLGVELSEGEMKKILTSLAFGVSEKSPVKITVPWWRSNDVKEEYDLIEEIARIYGYHNIPAILPDGVIPVVAKDKELVWESNVKHILVGLGFTESYNYSMVSKDVLKVSKTAMANAIKIDNPLNEDMEYMRVALAPQILQNVADNIDNFSNQKIFELSNVYLPTTTNKLPIEQSQLTGAVVSTQDTFRQARGVVEVLMRKLGISAFSLSPVADSYLLEKSKALEVKKGSKVLGQFGLVKQGLLDKYDIDKPVAIFDFDFSVLAKLATHVRKYQPVAEFPIIQRDLAVVIDNKVSWEEIEKVVSRADALITVVEYLSTFVDVKLGKSNKSIAFRLTLRSKDRTLKSVEADAVIQKVVTKLQKSFNIKVR